MITERTSVDLLLLCLLLASAASGAAAAVWAVSYWAEEELSVRRVRGTPERPEETSLILFWSRGRVTLSHRVRILSDAIFAPFARQYLGKGWFFYRGRYGAPVSIGDCPAPWFTAGRPRSDPEGPIEWRWTFVTVPCWFVVALLAAAPVAAWSMGGAPAQPLGVAWAAGALLALVPLIVAARRGRRTMQDAVQAIRAAKINAALREHRLEPGMTMEQVRQVLPDWTGHRTHYSIGRRANVEMWEFRRETTEAGAVSDEVIGVFFLDGKVGVATKAHPSPDT